MNTVAHQFDDAPQQLAAARLGMWVFLATEVLFFGGLFTAYFYYRSIYQGAFIAGSKQLDVVLGTLNTAILLFSSFTMALAVRSAQLAQRNSVLRFLALTALLGSIFLAIKGYEYYVKFSEHHVPGFGFSLSESAGSGINSAHVELFYVLYFGMTGLHALHMIIGIGAILVFIMALWSKTEPRNYSTKIELTGLYWHFIDIVWVFLFPLLYLVR